MSRAERGKEIALALLATMLGSLTGCSGTPVVLRLAALPAGTTSETDQVFLVPGAKRGDVFDFEELTVTADQRSQLILRGRGRVVEANGGIPHTVEIAISEDTRVHSDSLWWGDRTFSFTGKAITVRGSGELEPAGWEEHIVALLPLISRFVRPALYLPGRPRPVAVGDEWEVEHEDWITNEHSMPSYFESRRWTIDRATARARVERIADVEGRIVVDLAVEIDWREVFSSITVDQDLSLRGTVRWDVEAGHELERDVELVRTAHYPDPTGDQTGSGRIVGRRRAVP